MESDIFSTLKESWKYMPALYFWGILFFVTELGFIVFHISSDYYGVYLLETLETTY